MSWAGWCPVAVEDSVVAPPEKTPAVPAPSFQSVWGNLSRDLCNVLVGDGVSRQLAEDIVQETGIRLFVRWDQIDAGGSLMPLAVTIARNLVVDHHRKHDRVELQASPLQERASVDVEQRALARVHLGAVHRSLRKLNPRYRRLLLVEAGYMAEDGARDPAARTARARARQGLNILMDRMPDAAWVITAPIFRLGRRSSDKARQVLGRGDWVAVGQAAAGLGIFLASLPSPQLVAPENRVDSFPQPPSVQSASPVSSRVDTRGTAFVSAATRSAAGGSADSPAQWDPDLESTSRGGVGAFLPPAAHSEGEGTSNGSFGLHGFDEASEGDTTIAGEPVGWRYRVRYRNPGCVGSASAGQLEPGCDPTPRARAKATIRHGDDETTVDTAPR